MKDQIITLRCTDVQEASDVDIINDVLDFVRLAVSSNLNKYAEERLDAAAVLLDELVGRAERAATPTSDTTARVREDLVTMDSAGVPEPVDQELAAFIADFERARTEGALSKHEENLVLQFIKLRRLDLLSTAIQAQEEIVRGNIKQGVSLLNDQKFSCVLGSATISSPPTTVEIFDANQIPAGLMKVEPDKKRIGDLLRAGAAVAGSMLVQKGDPILRVSWSKGEKK